MLLRRNFHPDGLTFLYSIFNKVPNLTYLSGIDVVFDRQQYTVSIDEVLSKRDNVSDSPL